MPSECMNPLLFALFDYHLPSSKLKNWRQRLANTAVEYTLLVPTSYILNWSVEKDTLIPYSDYCLRDDFIGSHIIQMPSSTGARNSQRAKYCGTISGKTVIIRDGVVSTHKGFKSYSEARIVSEYIYNPGTDFISLEARFVVYEIQSPLVGVPIPSGELAPSIPVFKGMTLQVEERPNRQEPPYQVNPASFEHIMSKYPSFSRQVMSRIFNTIQDYTFSGTESELSEQFDDLVGECLDIFQRGNVSTITQIASDYNLTGEELASKIHVYVENIVYDELWAQIEAINRQQDETIYKTLEDLKHLDIGQIGLPISDFKVLFSMDVQVRKATEALIKISSAKGSDAKISVLQQIISLISMDQGELSADSLVSLLVLVVARSEIKSLSTEVSYIKNFSHQDAESGQLGYVVLTFQGVLYHVIKEGDKMKELARENERALKMASEGNLSYFVKYMDNADPEGMSVLRSRTINGDSLLTVSMRSSNYQVFSHLIEDRTVFPVSFILNDRTENGLTLLVSAIECENHQVIDKILSILSSLDVETQRLYLATQDAWRRTAAHYFFHASYLIRKLGHVVSWTARDQNGQTPLFALCRSYDNPQYLDMITLGLKANDGDLMVHIDNMGNSLLHVAAGSAVPLILDHKVDVNWPNNKGQTSLMMYAKFGKVEAMQYLCKEIDNDVSRCDYRGMRAIDITRDEAALGALDLIALGDGEVCVSRTAVSDNRLVFVITSNRLDNEPKTVTRSFRDFVFLQKWLAYENPYSWIPILGVLRSSYILPMKSSRQCIHEMQEMLESFLRTLLNHPKFSQHELLWEFLVVQDLIPEQCIDRSRRKLESQREAELNEVIVYSRSDLDLVEVFFSYALDETTKLSSTLYRLARSLIRLHNKVRDLSEAMIICETKFGEVQFLGGIMDLLEPCLSRFTHVDESSMGNTCVLFTSLMNSANSVINSLRQPLAMVKSYREQDELLTKTKTELVKLTSKQNPLGMFEEKRLRDIRVHEDKIYITQNTIQRISKDIKYSHITMASELGEFHQSQEKELEFILKKYSQTMLKMERERLQRLERMLGTVRGG